MPSLEEIKENIKPLVTKYGITRAGIFGSYARGDTNENSDIDLIFDFAKDFGLIELSGLKISLEEKLGKKVDIVEFSSLDPIIKDKILSEAVLIYEQG